MFQLTLPIIKIKLKLNDRWCSQLLSVGFKTGKKIGETGKNARIYIF